MYKINTKINSVSNKNTEYERKCLVFIIIFVLELFLRSKEEISIFSDHFGLLASAAKFANYDWNEVLKLSNYYGPGFFVVFTPLLKWCKNPILIYNIIVNTCLAIEAVAGTLLYHMLNKYITNSTKINNAIISVISSLFVLQSLVVSSFGNEQVIVLISLLIAIGIVGFVEHQEWIYKFLYGLSIGIICCWSITVHIRNIVFCIGIIAVFIYVSLIKKSSKRNIVLTAFGIVILIIIVLVLYKKTPPFFADLFFQSWNDIEGEKLNLAIEYIKSPFIETIEGIAYIFVGNIYESIMQTYGIILISYYLVFRKIFEFFRRIHKKAYLEKIPIEDIFLVFSSSMYFCALVAIAITEHGNSRMIGYWRYYGSYSILMIAVSLIFAFRNKNKKLIVGFIAFTLITFKIVLLLREWMTDDYLLLWFVYPGLKAKLSLECGLICTLVIILIGIVVLLYSSSLKNYCTYFFLFYLCINLGNGGLSAFYENPKCDIGYDLINSLYENEVFDYNEKIYFVGSDSTYMYYQFMLLGNGIERLLPAENDEIIVFSDCQSSGWFKLEDGWKKIELDDNEYLFSKSSEKIKNVENILRKLNDERR